jgi:fumarate hydratase subunit alpha
MREIDCSVISDAVEKLCIQAAVHLPPDLRELLEGAVAREESPAGAAALRDIVSNFKLAAESGLPICQERGWPWSSRYRQKAHIYRRISSRTP